MTVSLISLGLVPEELMMHVYLTIAKKWEAFLTKYVISAVMTNLHGFNFQMMVWRDLTMLVDCLLWL